jgi:hypothetical protein
MRENAWGPASAGNYDPPIVSVAGRRRHPTATMTRPEVDFRAMTPEDLPEASAMFARVMGLGAPALPGSELALERFFLRTFFECPWADPEIAPLVAENAAGEIVGMIGVETRRLLLDGRELRVASAGFLAVVPEARNSATGVLLLRRLLGGPQDLTVTDTASELVERIWLRLGGSRVELKGIHWVSILRPWSIGAGLAAAQAGRPAASGSRGALRSVAAGLDAVTVRAARQLLPSAPPDGVTVERLQPEHILEHLPAIAGDRPQLAYDRAYLRWLFAEMESAPRRGRLVAHLVRDGRGSVLGWYVYYLRRGWRSEVLQVAARERSMGAVVDHLLWHARQHGVGALRGRLEPGLVQEVARRRCLLWHRGGTLVHGRDKDLAQRVADEAVLTRFDTDWFGDTII